MKIEKYFKKEPFMKKDRFLIGILLGIVVLIVVALAVFFTRKDNLMYVDGSEPSDIVTNYVVAVHKKDYEKAYSYLADLPNKPTFENFKTAFINHSVDPASAGLEIGKAELSETTASVEFGIIFNPGDPFSGGYRNTEYGQLVKQNGVWKISQLPYTVWAYDWYTDMQYKQ